jgi:hypothetical protein
MGTNNKSTTWFSAQGISPSAAGDFHHGDFMLIARRKRPADSENSVPVRALAGSVIPTRATKAMIRILLVEDDEEVGRLLEQILISAGYEIDRSYAIAGACSRLDHRAYGLVLADARLPDGTGMDVADRAIEKGVKTLIIAGPALLYPELRRYEFLPNPGWI